MTDRETEQETSASDERKTASQLPLSKLGAVSPRAIKVLEEAGIRTLGALTELTFRELIAFPFVGRRTTRDIVEGLNEFGLKLTGSLPWDIDPEKQRLHAELSKSREQGYQNAKFYRDEVAEVRRELEAFKLTMRHYFVAAAMSGLLARDSTKTPRGLIDEAIVYADLMLEEINKPYSLSVNGHA